MSIKVTKQEVLSAKRAIVVLSEINKVAIQVLREKDKLGPVKEDLQTLIKIIRRLEGVAS